MSQSSASVKLPRSSRADRAVANQPHGLDVVGAGALLAADRADALRSPGLVDHDAALAQHQRQRLLDVDVLAGPQRRHRHQGVPVVGRGDDDGVDVLVVEHLSEVVQGDHRGVRARARAARVRRRCAAGRRRRRPGERPGFHRGERPVAERPVDVADRHHRGVGRLQKAIRHLAAASAAADQADAHPIVRAHHPHAAERGRHAQRNRGASKVPSRHVAHMRNSSRARRSA
jgi:hypothetical protein